MVERQQQHMLGVAQAQHRGAQQGPAGEVKRAAVLGQGQLAHAREALGGRDVAQVGQAEECGGVKLG